MNPKELSEAIKAAEIAMHQAKRQCRPLKDNSFPGTDDRDIQQNGLAAEAIAEYNHLLRLWELERELANG